MYVAIFVFNLKRATKSKTMKCASQMNADFCTFLKWENVLETKQPGILHDEANMVEDKEFALV